MQDLRDLIFVAGRTHVIPWREDPALLQRLRAPTVLAEARRMLASKDRKSRHAAILCVERIHYALHDQESVEVLLSHADATNDLSDAATALKGVANCSPPQALPSAPLLRLARRREWRIWWEAISCLHLAPTDKVESVLLERLDADRYGLVLVAKELRFMKSADSLAALEKLLDNSDSNVRAVALYSMGFRMAEGVVRFARKMGEGNWFDQIAAEHWLSKYGSDDDIPFFAKRAKLMENSKRSCHPPRLSIIVPFLQQRAGVPAAGRALDRLFERASRLPTSEREWLNQNRKP